MNFSIGDDAGGNEHHLISFRGRPVHVPDTETTKLTGSGDGRSEHRDTMDYVPYNSIHTEFQKSPEYTESRLAIAGSQGKEGTDFQGGKR